MFSNILEFLAEVIYIFQIDHFSTVLFVALQMSRNQSVNRLSTNRSVILHYWNKGYRCAAEIARRTKIPVRTVRYNIAKLKQRNSVDHRGGNGRHRKITPEDSIAIGQWIRRNNEITARELVTKLGRERHRNVSRWTMQRQLARLGYRNVLPRATPMLTQQQKERRVKWAMQHKNDDWSRTVFSDETSFQLFRNTVRRWSKHAGREFKRIPKDRQKVMAWGACSSKGQLAFHSFKRIMDGSYYVSILREHLLCGARRQFGGRWRFQQDNDPKHTCRLAKQFLEQNVPETIDWPANSPDLNPVENLWSVLKLRVEKRRPKNQEELERFLHEEWERIPMSTVSHLIDSMKFRCLAVIDSAGERINY